LRRRILNFSFRRIFANWLVRAMLFSSP